MELKYEILITGAILLVVCYVVGLVKRWKSNLPPGPMGLPFVGYLPFLSENSFLDLMKLGKKYGDVFSLPLGSETVVVLHGPEAIREAFSKNEFLGRPSNNTLELTNKGSAFFTNDIHAWKEQRKFVVQSMKDLGLGKTKIERDIQDEISCFLETLRKHNGKTQDIKVVLSASLSNNISALIFGQRFEYHDPSRIYLDENLDIAEEEISQTSSYTYFPWLRFIPFSIKLFKIENSMKAFANVRKYFGKEVENHKKTLDPRNVRDFIDSFLMEMKSRQQKEPDTSFTDSTLLSNVTDLFGAGSEPVRTSILWAVYIMAAFPDVQSRIQKEIRKIIGQERNPEFLDMKSMPFTHAVILEIMRWKTIVPLNVLRYTLHDTSVRGYDVPKNTIVIANFWNAHHDPRYWTEPDTFEPERFLNEYCNTVVKPSSFMPFSLGRRVCPGETMAYMEIFLYLVSMLQKFDVVFPNGYEPTFKAKSSVTYRKEPYHVRFIPKD